MKACRWCGIVSSPMTLVPVWERDIEAFIENFVCCRCEEKAWEAYRASGRKWRWAH